MHYRSRGQRQACRSSIRIPFGGGIGAVEHHSESPEAYFAHTAGLRSCACSNPADAYWMIQQAIACDDPIVFLEPKRRYWEKGEVDLDAPPTPTRCTPSRVVRPGTDATVLAYGPMVRTCAGRGDRGRRGRPRARGHRPALALPARPGPGRTSRCGAPAGCVVVHEAPGNLGLGAEIAARITEECFYSLEAPVLRVDRLRHPVPGRPGRGGVPARPRPGARRRRPLVRLVSDDVTDQGVQAARPRRGPHRGRDPQVAGQGRRHVELNQPIVEVETAKAAVEIPAQCAGAVHAICHPEGDDRRGRHADHRDRHRPRRGARRRRRRRRRPHRRRRRWPRSRWRRPRARSSRA